MNTKTFCVLTDGESIADRKELSAIELIQENERAKQATDGNWSWGIDQNQKGLIPFDVALYNSTGDCSDHFTILGPTLEFVKTIYALEWRFVSVLPHFPAR